MRYLLDTNAYIYWATDQDLLDVDVYDLLNEPDAVLCISAESVRELIVATMPKDGATSDGRQLKTWSMP